jgi:hypothetical protein
MILLYTIPADEHRPHPNASYILADSTRVVFDGPSTSWRSTHFTAGSMAEYCSWSAVFERDGSGGYGPEWYDAAERASHGDLAAASAVVDMLIERAGDEGPAGNGMSPAAQRAYEAKQNRMGLAGYPIDG